MNVSCAAVDFNRFVDSLCVQENTTLRNIVWRLESRQSFKINRNLTRNKDIYRRLQEGRSISDLDPKLQNRVSTSQLKLAEVSSVVTSVRIYYLLL